MTARRPLLFDTAATHGPVTAAISAAVAGFAATAITDWADSPPWAVPLACVVIAVAAGGVAVANNLTLLSAGYRASCWMTAGAWSWYARTHEAQFPYLEQPVVWWANPSNWYLGATLAIVGGLTSGTLAYQQRRAEDLAAAALRREQQQRLAADGDRSRIAALVVEGLAAHCAIGKIEPITDPETKKQLRDPLTGEVMTRVAGGAVIHAVEYWKDEHGNQLGTGYTVDGDMPSGKTYESVQNLLGMVSHLDLPSGCGIEVTEGNRGRRSFLMKVQTKDSLKEDFPYPAEFLEPHSVEGDSPFGMDTTGKALAIPMRYDNVTVAGPPDAGKTNTINDLGLWDATGVDGILVDFDMTGTLSTPYVEPWLEAQLSGDPQRIAAVPQPCVGINAPNLPIAWLVSELMTIAVVKRKTGYRRLMRNMRLPVAPSPEQGGVPLLRARIDEGGAFHGTYLGQLVRKNIEKIGGEGRPAAIRVLWCGLRGVDKFIPTDVAALAHTLIALRPTKRQELGLYLGWEGGFPDLDKVQKKGSGYLKMGTTTLKAFRTYRVGDDQVDVEDFVKQVCARASRWQPVLDPVTAAVFNAPTQLLDDPEVTAFFRGQPGVEEDDQGVLTISNFWDNRWQIVLPVMFPDYADQIREMFGAPVPAGAAASSTTTAAPTRPTTTGGTPVKPTLSGAVSGLNAANEKMTSAAADLNAAVEEAKRRQAAGLPPEHSLLGGEVPPPPAVDSASADAPVDPAGPPAGDGDEVDTSWIPDHLDGLPPELQHKQFIEEFTVPERKPGQPSPLIASSQAAAPDVAEQRLMLLGYIVEAGEEGIQARDLRLRLQSELALRWQLHIEFNDQTFHNGRMKRLKVLQLIHKPYAPGEDADPMDAVADRRHNYVATAKGRAYYERELAKRNTVK
ncbi:hypothetical protein AB0F93_03570 [Micromonospora tulbaghiae]|uniref:hypothetical protein n=1 Tax=Micromonospora tulbaghiae TaxID=479978 RepID=UPI003330F02C